ncbi:lipid A deacylase LpxR family protein [Salinivibrio kushneri]|uniref:lipid A deacylase LpxR family protein n=1 Tax=Salinivibrio kushneri TaxID=1908198 RepID=UPI0022B3DCA4|nr:lipid A deacylase LpxR family protein [Salinivibrio kushneri]WBA13177.1 lipid A deacylase LpxR family protein [Salinivibrio kushneri]
MTPSRVISGTILLFPTLLLAPSAALAAGFGLTIENDSPLGVDNQYTSGVYAHWHADWSDDLRATSVKPIRWFAEQLPLNESARQGWSVDIGQMMWTPNDITYTTPQPEERPYAGLIFIEPGLYQQTPERVDKWSLMLGMVGPASQTEEGQSYVHDLIDSPDPKGWDYQVENTPVAQLAYERHQLLHRSEHQEWGVTGRADIGNFRSELSAGLSYRVGLDLANTYGGISFEPGRHLDSRLFEASEKGAFLYTAIQGRYRANDITINGDKPPENADIDMTHWQASAAAGVAFYQPRWGTDISVVLHTKDYEQAIDNTYSYVSWTVHYRY